MSLNTITILIRKIAHNFITPSLIITLLILHPAYGQENVRNSVVKIHTTQRSPDIYKPWTKLAPSQISGSGVVIEGNRILTNAHVVTYASQVYVQPYQSAEKYPAKVVGIAPGIDLALLELEDESFFNEYMALPMAEKLPKPGDTINAYGYPLGGTGLSVTEGIVSRIEFSQYYYETSGLRIQVDAPLNPGNSGGPALYNGNVVGIVFSAIKKAENIGYLIPVEEIKLFLEDISDGSYDGKPMLFDELQTLENGALKDRLGLKPNQTGMMVNKPADYSGRQYLNKWDVITRIGGNSIDNEGRVIIKEDIRLNFTYLIQHLIKNGKIDLTVIRDGKELEVTMPLISKRDHLVPYLMQAYPRYFIYGPLVFSPATQEFLRFLNRQWRTNLLERSSPLITRLMDDTAFEGEELVIVASSMFSHKITKGYDNPYTFIVKEVNGVKVKNLNSLVEQIRDMKETFVEFTFDGNYTETMVFRRDEMESATEDVLSENGIRFQCSEDIRKIWNR